MKTSAVSSSEFWLLDLDRTLFDTDRAAGLLYQLADELSIMTVTELAARQRQSEVDGQSFDPMSTIVEQAGQDGWSQLTTQFEQQAASEDFLLPGAEDLIKYLTERHRPHAILTYGNPKWQEIKLATTGLNVPYLVVTSPYKSVVVREWQNDDGTFQIPSAIRPSIDQSTARRIVLVDDKPLAFEDLPVNVTGYLITSRTPVLSLPNVHVYPNLSSLKIALNNKS